MWTVKGLLAEQNSQIMCSYYSRNFLRIRRFHLVQENTPYTLAGFLKDNDHNTTKCHENTHAKAIST